MADDEPVGAAGETSVGDQGHIFAQAFAHHRGGGSEHFAHAGAALGSLVADNNDVTLFHRAFEDVFEGGFFRVEDPGCAAEFFAFFAGNFRHGPAGCEVAVEDDEMAVFLDRIFERPDDLLAFGVGLERREVLLEGLAGHGEAVAVEQAGREELLHERNDTADGDKFGHEIFAARFEVGQHRDAAADLGEVVDVQFDLGGVGHGEEVEHGIGRAAQRDDQGDGIFKGLAGQNVRGNDAPLEQLHHRGAGIARVGLFVRGDGDLRRAVGQAHAHGFDRRGHGVGRVHAAARSGAGNGAGFDLLQLFVVDRAGCALAHSLEHGDHVEVFAVEAAGKNGAAVDKDRGAVEAGDGQHAAGHVFIASADGNKAVEAFAADDGFDRVGNHFARDERVFHPFGPHGNAVRNGDGVEDGGFASGRVGPTGSFAGEHVEVHVARGDHAPGGGDGYLRLGEIFGLEPDRIEHGAARSAFGSVKDLRGITAKG